MQIFSTTLWLVFSLLYGAFYWTKIILMESNLSFWSFLLAVLHLPWKKKFRPQCQNSHFYFLLSLLIYFSYLNPSGFDFRVWGKIDVQIHFSFFNWISSSISCLKSPSFPHWSTILSLSYIINLYKHWSV